MTRLLNWSMCELKNSIFSHSKLFDQNEIAKTRFKCQLFVEKVLKITLNCPTTSKTKLEESFIDKDIYFLKALWFIYS